MKKNVLIFGDSNTWGWKPISTLDNIQRFGKDVRWASLIENLLGEDYDIFAEGLNGRTTVWDDPLEEFRCGKHHLIPMLDTHSPLDLVVIFLGTNDLKSRYSLTAEDVAFGAGLLVQKTKAHLGDIKILLVCPPPIGPLETGIFTQLFKGGYETSLQFGKYYEGIAKANNVEYIDLGKHIETSLVDSIHLDAETHKKLADVMAAKIKEIL